MNTKEIIRKISNKSLRFLDVTTPMIGLAALGFAAGDSVGGFVGTQIGAEVSLRMRELQLEYRNHKADLETNGSPVVSGTMEAVLKKVS